MPVETSGRSSPSLWRQEESRDPILILDGGFISILSIVLILNIVLILSIILSHFMMLTLSIEIIFILRIVMIIALIIIITNTLSVFSPNTITITPSSPHLSFSPLLRWPLAPCIVMSIPSPILESA